MIRAELVGGGGSTVRREEKGWGRNMPDQGPLFLPVSGIRVPFQV